LEQFLCSFAAALSRTQKLHMQWKARGLKVT